VTDQNGNGRNAQASDAIADLRALMDSLRQNVDQLKAILAEPEVPDGDPAQP
jgi:hypothetical protein